MCNLTYKNKSERHVTTPDVMPFMRRDLFVTVTFMHPHLLILSFIHSELRETCSKTALSWKQAPKNRSSANSGAETRMMWWELWKKTYDVMFLGTFQIALYLPLGWVSKEMLESIVEGSAISHRSGMMIRGTCLGHSRATTCFQISGSSVIFTWPSPCLPANYPRVT